MTPQPAGLLILNDETLCVLPVKHALRTHFSYCLCLLSWSASQCLLRRRDVALLEGVGIRVWESGILFSGSCSNLSFPLRTVPLHSSHVEALSASRTAVREPGGHVDRSQTGSAPSSRLRHFWEAIVI